MRAAFYPLLFPRPPAASLWRIDPPDSVPVPEAAALYEGALDVGSIEVSRPFVRDGLREYWLRAPTPSAAAAPAARQRDDVCPRRRAGRAGVGETLILGSGLCLEFELLASAHDPGRRLAAMGWRVIEPISPYHGLRAMPGF